MAAPPVVVSRPRVLVVGAGPAGSTAARLLAERGACVTLFEARRLPRSKVCGGGLTPKAQRQLPARANSTIVYRVDSVEIHGGHVPPVRIQRPAAEIAMVERDRFDLALAEAAADAGAEVRDGERVIDAGEDHDGAWVATQRGQVRGDVLVAADGEPSRVAHRLGFATPPRRLAFALDIDAPPSATVPRHTAVLSYSVGAGYAWYFPKGDHANLGVASARRDRRTALREDLMRFAATLGLDLAGDAPHGHWLPIGLRRGPLASRRVVLAGDAAATVDPLFGEGIAYALHSARLAAETIEEWSSARIPDLRAYDGRLLRSLEPAFTELGRIAHAVELSTSAVLLALRASEAAREVAVDAIAGRRRPFALRLA